MKALDQWKRQDLAPESRQRLQELLGARRHEAEDREKGEALLDAFLATLDESQLTAFARMLRELTTPVH